MNFNLQHAIDSLRRTPEVLITLLEGRPDMWVAVDEGGDTWSAFDVVGHLVHGELTDWIPRLHIVLEGNMGTFEPFDRFAQFESSKGKTLRDLLHQFAVLRETNLDQLVQLNITEDQYNMEAIHPELGKVTLRNLLATWVAHDLNHIAQISRVMAKYYKEDVGVWKNYLGILNR
jgi:hypothetical protein